MGVQEGAAQRGSAWLIGSSGRTKEAVGSPIFGMGGRIVAALEVDIGDTVSPIHSILPARSVTTLHLSRELGACASTAWCPVSRYEDRDGLRSSPGRRVAGESEGRLSRRSMHSVGRTGHQRRETTQKE